MDNYHDEKLSELIDPAVIAAVVLYIIALACLSFGLGVPGSQRAPCVRCDICEPKNGNAFMVASMSSRSGVRDG
jgi:hypothetical protein